MMIRQVPQHSLSPDMLAAELMQLYGANLLALRIGEDMVFAGGVLQTWPSRVGPIMAAPALKVITKGILNGRVVGTNAVGGASVIALNNVSANSSQAELIVAKADILPFVGYVTATSYLTPPTGLREIFTGLDTGSQWYGSPAVSHFSDGAATEAVDTNWHIYESHEPTGAAKTNKYLFGSYTLNRNWIGSIAFDLATTIIPTALERLITNELLKQYYGL